MMLSLNFGEKLICEYEEKRECINTAKLIMELSQKAHMCGLMKLENDISDDSPFWRKACRSS
ncbi:MAG: hypothetical protein ACOZCL_10000 [Bacillota bacterium]